MKWSNRYPTDEDREGIYINDGSQPYITKGTSNINEAIASFKRTYSSANDDDGNVKCTAENLKTGTKKSFWL
jgi:hypothetical protein